MICSKCGNALPEGAKFCSVCGTPVSSDSSSSYYYETPVNPQYPDNLSDRTYTDLNQLEAEMSGGRPRKATKSVTKGALIAIIAVLIIAVAVVFIAATGSRIFRGIGPGSSSAPIVGEWTGDKLYMGDYPLDASMFDFSLNVSRDGTFELREFSETGTGTYQYVGTGTDNDGEPYTAFELAYKDAQGDEYRMDLLYYEHFNGGREYLIIALSDDLMISFVRAG